MQRLLFLLVFFSWLKDFSQELYPNSEPASIIPKNVIGFRAMNEAFSSNKGTYIWNGAMFMYGVNSKMMVSAMFTGSNHHRYRLPDNFIVKDLLGKPVLTRSSSPDTYKFESVNLGFRYRFLNVDGDHRHFRMALYGNGVYAFQPHDEAEITLMGDNKAIGGGVISTLLIKRLAISFTGGAIKPFSYAEKATGYKIMYGEAFNYSLSFGYLLFPLKYKNFKETNVNLYAEFLGKTYNPLTFCRYNNKVSVNEEEEICGGNYIELRPAVQFIVKSNLRIDLSTAIPLVNRSYIRQYPLYLINLQYYLFL